MSRGSRVDSPMRCGGTITSSVRRSASARAVALYDAALGVPHKKTERLEHSALLRQPGTKLAEAVSPRAKDVVIGRRELGCRQNVELDACCLIGHRIASMTCRRGHDADLLRGHRLDRNELPVEPMHGGKPR